MRPAVRLWIRRLAPWAITAAVVAAILSKYSLERIYRELARGDPWAVIPFAVGLPLAHLAIQAVWDRWIIVHGTGTPVSYFDVVRGRAGSAVLLALGFAFSSGGYGVWIARKTGTDARTTFGVVVYLLMNALIAVCLVAAVTVWLGAAALEGKAGSALGVTSSAVGVFAPLIAGGLAVISLAGPRLLGDTVSRRRFLAPWSRVPPHIFAASVAGRCLDILMMIGFTYLAANAFGLELPLEVMASYLPIIILIGALPINVAGFGAVQAAWLVFEPWAQGEQILAFQFIWHLWVSIAIALRGAPFLRGVLREVEEGRPVSAAEREAQMVSQRL